jgi:hypothetical protein
MIACPPEVGDSISKSRTPAHREFLKSGIQRGTFARNDSYSAPKVDRSVGSS